MKDGWAIRRIFIRDKRTNVSVLVDTGADACIYPRNKVRGPANKSDYEPDCDFTWSPSSILSSSLQVVFCSDWCANVYFLSHSGLLVDPRNKRFLDTTTQLSTRRFAATLDVASIKTINVEPTYHKIMAEFPDLTDRRRMEPPPTPNHASSLPIDSRWRRRDSKSWSNKAWCCYREARGHHPRTSYPKRMGGFDLVATIGHWTPAPFRTGTHRRT